MTTIIWNIFAEIQNGALKKQNGCYIVWFFQDNLLCSKFLQLLLQKLGTEDGLKNYIVKYTIEE